MKVDITLEDVAALHENDSFKQGYLAGISGNEPPLPDPNNLNQTLNRLGHLVAKQLRELESKS